MVAEPIDIDNYLIADRLLALDRPADALRAPAYGSRQMQEGVELASARQGERLQRFEILVHPIDFVLELFDLALAHLMHAWIFDVRRSGKLAADIEKLVLDSPQHLGIPFVML